MKLWNDEARDRLAFQKRCQRANFSDSREEVNRPLARYVIRDDERVQKGKAEGNQASNKDVVHVAVPEGKK